MTPDPFHFIHKCQIGALPFFYWKGEGHLFWQYFTVPGTGFDTTSFRNSNHNKFGRHFFSFCKEAQDYLAERLLFSLVNFMWALAGWVFPWVERGNILSCTDSENSYTAEWVFPSLKQVIKLFWSCFWPCYPLSQQPFPTPYIAETILSGWIFLTLLSHISWPYMSVFLFLFHWSMSVFMPMPYSFYYTFEMKFEIKKCDPSSFILS